MKKLCCTLVLALAASGISSAADAPPSVKEVTPKNAPAAIQAIVLTNQSSFNLEGSGRNPFWPIGWKPAAKSGNGNEAAAPEVAPTAFLVSSIVLDPGAKFAIVNGKTMQEGQVFGLQVGNQTYQITVKAIEDGKVVFARRDEEIEVPLRRK